MAAFSTLTALALALMGGGLAKAVGIPAPWLLGAVVGSLLLGLTRRRPNVSKPVRWLAFLLLGYLIGSTASASFLGSLVQWVPSLLVMLLLVPVVTLVSAAVLMRLSDLSADEAVLCSLPGALPFAIGASEDMGLRTDLVSMFQSLRLLSLTLMLPFVLLLLPLSGLVAESPTGAPSLAVDDPLEPVGLSLMPWLAELSPLILSPGSLLLAAGFAGLAALVRIPGALFIGPMAGIAALKIIGLPLPDLPGVVVIGAQAALGWIMGTRFDAIPLDTFGRLALACFGGLLAGFTVVVAAMLGLIALTELPARELVLALAPGAIETTTAIALDRDLDPLFVSTHQMVRMLFIPVIALGLLAVGRRLLIRRGSTSDEGR